MRFFAARKAKLSFACIAANEMRYPIGDANQCIVVIIIVVVVIVVVVVVAIVVGGGPYIPEFSYGLLPCPSRSCIVAIIVGNKEIISRLHCNAVTFGSRAPTHSFPVSFHKRI
jgi:hypothetical protein